ncbi:MAG: AAA family ATPase [Candidatus Kerfeldbacteria bacterium RIFCSPLOWO2_01_FULL_48_11]|uniref:Replication-associated recombination protein A n=1 Tax=Candidatus Kerfeldbacteria bacterium RIFCSPLOWO2_01_FULL_48_11 TaxID=1798543 RepID=A0A1G2B1Q8_9BACT|nr:MAG: Recombination protein MgsA [Parcubacteria group bacterium GW2011_GWA2_48_9]OGY83088.1 MAG: AAA family ATPase [Candidatus Kerfeldbacteria bacterium RIFCSPLOWO2_01_FULL_48_11]HCM68118.1 AAA family ATPase [Candidatus Kerfeldbacteria bacterium]
MKKEKSLFEHKMENDMRREAPLADRMRSRTFDEFFGQEKIVGPGTLLRRAIENDELFSIIFWGPPGSGKTTLARVIAELTKSHFEQMSAVTSGIGDLRKVIEEAEKQRSFHNERTILFVDEIHRWNKAQQDAFLSVVESGLITLIGATTENPSFEVIAPLLSRTRVFVLERLGVSELSKIVKQALKDKVRGLGKEKIQIVAKAMDLLLEASNGDARTVLNALEIASKAARKDKQGIKHISLVDVEDALQHKALQYDKKGEEHYNVISAFIKSMRGSNPDGALYWLNRMVEAGEDPEFIARRMVIFASEDVGMADPGALRIALDVFNAVRVIGYPECQINLAHGVVYLANAPKDNSAYKGLLEAKKDVQDSMNEPVPLHLRNAVTDLMKDLKYGEGYKYSHDFTPEEGEQDYLPEKLRGKKYYKPRK